MRDTWSLSDCNGTQIHSHLVRKQTLNHLAKLANYLSSLATWLSVRLRTNWMWVRVPSQSLKVVLYFLLLNRNNVLQKVSPQLMNNYSRDILNEDFLWLEYCFSSFVIYWFLPCLLPTFVTDYGEECSNQLKTSLLGMDLGSSKWSSSCKR